MSNPLQTITHPLDDVAEATGLPQSVPSLGEPTKPKQARTPPARARRGKTIKVLANRHGHPISPKTVNRVVQSALEGNNYCQTATALDIDRGTVAKYVKRIELPQDYPDESEAWSDELKVLLRIGIWKAVRRLAAVGMDTMCVSKLPVSAAILIDKYLMLTGQPTSTSFVIHGSVPTIDLKARLEANKRVISTSTVVDVEEVK